MLNTQKSYPITKKVELSSYPCCCIYDTRSSIMKKIIHLIININLGLKFLRSF